MICAAVTTVLGAIKVAPPSNIVWKFSFLRTKQVWGHSPGCEVTLSPIEFVTCIWIPPLFNPNLLCKPHLTGFSGADGVVDPGLQQTLWGFSQGEFIVSIVIPPAGLGLISLALDSKFAKRASSISLSIYRKISSLHYINIFQHSI